MNDIKEVYFRIKKSKEYNLLKNSILDETPCSTDDQSYVYLIIPSELNIPDTLSSFISEYPYNETPINNVEFKESDLKEFNILKLPKPVFYIFGRLDEEDRNYIDNIINLINKG